MNDLIVTLITIAVAMGAIDHQAGQAADVGFSGHQVADAPFVQPAVVVDDQHVAGRRQNNRFEKHVGAARVHGRSHAPRDSGERSERLQPRRAQANGNAVSMFFAQVFGFATRDVVADSIAARDSSGGGACILALDPTGAFRWVAAWGGSETGSVTGSGRSATTGSRPETASSTPVTGATELSGGGAVAAAGAWGAAG